MVRPGHRVATASWKKWKDISFLGRVPACSVLDGSLCYGPKISKENSHEGSEILAAQHGTVHQCKVKSHGQTSHHINLSGGHLSRDSAASNAVQSHDLQPDLDSKQSNTGAHVI